MAVNLGGLSQTANGTARVDYWGAVPNNPPSGYVGVTTTLTLKYNGDATQGGNYGGELQLDTSASFGAPTIRTITTLTDGALITETFTGLSASTQYYWRVRGQSPYGGYSPWSAVQTAWILPQGAIATMAVPVNVYVQDPHETPEWTPFNVGNYPFNETPEWTPFNVGNYPFNETPEFAVMNVYARQGGNEAPEVASLDVSTNTPTPHIWWLKENIGREGDGFIIFGYGFGTNAAEFNGEPLWQWEVGNEVPLGVVTWNSYPASSNAYNANRLISPGTNHSDPVHQIVGVIVPVGAVPPGYLVRFRTDGAP